MENLQAHPHPSPVYELLALLQSEVLLEGNEVPDHLKAALLYSATHTPLLVAGEAKLNGVTLGAAGDSYDTESVTFAAA